MGKQKRDHAKREDITEGSRWAPFTPSDRLSPLVTILETPAPDAVEVRVKGHAGRCYSTRIVSLLDTYYPVQAEAAPVLHESRPAARAEPKPGLVRTSPSPIVLNGDGNTVTLDGHAFAVHVFRGRACVIAADLGRALGYSDDGGELVRSIGGWSEFRKGQRLDFEILRYRDLKEFKAILDVGARAALSRAPNLCVLFETGMDLACQKAQTPAGERLRRYLADEVLPKLRRGEAPSAVAAPVPDPTLPPSSEVGELKGMVRDMLGAVAGLVQLVNVVVRAASPALPPAPVATPPDPVPADWLTHADMARKLPATEGQIATLIRKSDNIRGNADVCRSKLIEKGDGSRHSTFFYHPSVLGFVSLRVRGVVGTLFQVEGGVVATQGTDVHLDGKPAA